ncbi:pyrroline-5-carboxylate reductase [Azospirillum lipoferum]|uniref:Pyrroline-5-carboxylate reductase n=1 Tax=Azospirillum lipoferum TaxID=193 RepID=A0A5A9GMI6_AZOLI|nr:MULTISPECIES: pyrroline-5-carboxylate reductase [Azospirillum]KAA0595670.1 pyrroline-5-carboxylate reductase [Azospirillum lipoferum]MCP1611467.1 pyrroline-5-carboxylate reductase [Azospirillum lipoferum]MDW5537269.1 pyrroline-5-carboxylate reductase [Azospirillum sp. NL1]
MANLIMYGCGHMGFPIAKAILDGRGNEASPLIIVEADREKADLLRRTLACDVVASHRPAPDDALILAVKPVDTRPLADSINHAMGPDNLIVSVMAGVTTAELSECFRTRQVIRTIPNTPCLIGQGITVFCRTPEVTGAHHAHTLRLLGCLGQVVEVPEEAMIDKATGISGSGPAYVFYLAEALRDCAVEMGFSRSDAWSLATETVAGAGALLRARQEDPTTLRHEVMTPKGTTAAAIDHLERHHVGRIMQEAFQASWQRAASLGTNPLG